MALFSKKTIMLFGSAVFAFSLVACGGDSSIGGDDIELSSNSIETSDLSSSSTTPENSSSSANSEISSSSFANKICEGQEYDPGTEYCFEGVIKEYGEFIDSRNDRTYKYVEIGAQTWMAENLNYAAASGSWCYEDDASNCDTYGRLYDWETATEVCPGGWHLPSDDEWTALVNFAGGGLTAGTALKSMTGWVDNGDGFIAGADDLGFSALPGGSRNSEGSFFYAGSYSQWWSNSEVGSSGSSDAHYLSMMTSDAGITEGSGNKNDGFSVRCIKNSGVVSSSSANPEISSSSLTNKICGSQEYDPGSEYCSGGVVKEYGEFTDTRDDQTYKYVEIGAQTWMAKNLNYAAASGNWCYKDGDSNCKTYGRLYDWETARNVCPDGWHLPSGEEWTVLVDFAGGLGIALKSATSWDGTDDYGFNALPGGYRSYGGSFGDIGSNGYWWSASEGSSSNAYSRFMGSDIAIVSESNDNKSYGYSVRCVKD
ncbi:MAG: fibrobacter succinogenes major paralogous domain-containing protein [Fibrobacter sp.]|jgi:uncharacterized protein (TIGR02145 family)|nr:fibrobacter succinogenes major paralogous domain-containing protein [Fibrobacter sp.]